MWKSRWVCTHCGWPTRNRRLACLMCCATEYVRGVPDERAMALFAKYSADSPDRPRAERWHNARLALLLRDTVTAVEPPHEIYVYTQDLKGRPVMEWCHDDPCLWAHPKIVNGPTLHWYGAVRSASGVRAPAAKRARSKAYSGGRAGKVRGGRRYTFLGSEHGASTVCLGVSRPRGHGVG